MMDLRFLYSIILTVLPFTELRAGLPLAITFALDKNIPLAFVVVPIILINILLIFLIFYFLDRFHEYFLKFKFYRRGFDKFLERFQKKVDKFEKRYDAVGFIALALFVSVPLPGSGAWSGSIISWLLGLDRKKSVLAISAGVTLAGIIVFLGTLGVINVFF